LQRRNGNVLQTPPCKDCPFVLVFCAVMKIPPEFFIENFTTTARILKCTLHSISLCRPFLELGEGFVKKYLEPFVHPFRMFLSPFVSSPPLLSCLSSRAGLGGIIMMCTCPRCMSFQLFCLPSLASSFLNSAASIDLFFFCSYAWGSSTFSFDWAPGEAHIYIFLHFVGYRFSLSLAPSRKPHDEDDFSPPFRARQRIPEMLT